MFTRREGRILLIISGLLLVIFSLRLWLPQAEAPLSPTDPRSFYPLLSPRLEPKGASSASPAPAPEGWSVGSEAEYQELEAEEDLWYEERRWRNGNWIWEPTEGELAAHEGLLFVAPIVDAEGRPVIADVFVNDEPAGRTDVVALLMWDTVNRPVTLDVLEEGYHPWSMSFRFVEAGEVRRLEGEILLERKE